MRYRRYVVSVDVPLKFPIDLDTYDRLLIRVEGYEVEFTATRRTNINSRAELISILQSGVDVVGDDFAIIVALAGEKEAAEAGIKHKLSQWIRRWTLLTSVPSISGRSSETSARSRWILL